MPPGGPPAIFVQLLTHISHQWRAIALSTPGLWQSITFDYRVYEHKDCEKLLDMWLLHSAELPLFLSFGCRSDETQRLIDTSLIHCHRWQEITVMGSVALDVPEIHFSILRKVTLGRDISGTITIQNAPALCEASTRLVPNPYYNVQLPWAQLTTLSVTTFGPPGDCLPMLWQCSNRLLHFSRTEGVQHAFNSGVGRITLQSLVSLDLHGSGIIDHLTLPVLRHLSLAAEFHAGVERYRVQQLLARSSAVLQCLSLTFHKTQRPSLTEIHFLFQLVPTVTDLRLVLPAHINLAQLVGCFSSPDTLPLLANLVIDAARVWDNYNALLAVLGARRSRGPVTLTSFELSLRPRENVDEGLPPIPEAGMVQFRDLAAAGLNTRIRFESSIILDTFPSQDI